MRRRTFIQSLLGNLALLAASRRARAQSLTSDDAGSVTMAQLAEVVLPSSPGAARPEDIAAQFEEWIRNYPAGADAGYGYGFTNPRVLGPNPSTHYAEDLRQLELAASAKGSSFASLSTQEKRGLVRSALTMAGITSIPPHPSGQHVASDLMSYFYSSSEGEDLCYDAAIRRKYCRGLAGSDQRPARLS